MGHKTSFQLSVLSYQSSVIRLKLTDASCVLLLCFFEALGDFGPVDYVPPGGEVVGTLVLVFQVVGVLPDVVAEDGVKALAQGRILVGGGDDLELAALADEPAPAGAELLGGGLIEVFLKASKSPKSLVDLVSEGAGGRAATAGFWRGHDGPEHGVVGVASAVVADTPRMSSGTALRSLMRSSTDLAARLGWLASAPFTLLM